MKVSLDNLVQYLRAHPVKLVNNNKDGRINSAESEKGVIDALINAFGDDDIEAPKIRDWYDIKIKSSNQFINIKISDLNNHAADNLSAKIGMGYALTGKENLPIGWKKFHEELAANITYGYDYYFLIINKSNVTDVFWTSLKKIPQLVSNGNNPPFQCDWSKNRTRSSRTEKEATRYILEKYIESWDKKIVDYPSEIKGFLDCMDRISTNQ